MPFDISALNKYVLVLSGFGTAFLLALWVSLIIWTFRDIRSRSRDALLRILAILIVALLNIPGIAIYFILRPTRTLEQEYHRTLEDEALLLSIEENDLCPGCSRRVRDDWLLCPKCQTKLKQSCPGCGRAIERSWAICPFCGAPASDLQFEGLAQDVLITPPSSRGNQIGK